MAWTEPMNLIEWSPLRTPGETGPPVMGAPKKFLRKTHRDPCPHLATLPNTSPRSCPRTRPTSPPITSLKIASKSGSLIPSRIMRVRVLRQAQGPKVGPPFPGQDNPGDGSGSVCIHHGTISASSLAIQILISKIFKG
jgi:hypothetical protein